MSPRCNWINEHGVQCGMPLHHPGQHGNGLLTTGLDTWHEYIGNVGPVAIVETGALFGVVWTDKSTNRRCPWSGPNTLCIYETGHTLPHKEDIHGH